MSKETVLLNGKENITSAKRPTQKLYVPKHMRTKQNEQIDKLNTSLENEEKKSFKVIEFNDPSIIGYIGSTNTDKIESSTCEEDLLKGISSLSLKTTDKEKNNDWFDMYNELGESIEKSIPNNSNKKEQEPKEKNEEEKKIDYYHWDPPVEDLSEEEYGHIIEIYEFPAAFKNENIFSAIKEFTGNQDFDLKWVDDTHCLGVFSSVTTAANVLKLNNSFFLKTRPLSKATNESKRKAQRIVNYLKPYKPRPQTTSFIASRLIGASLGLNNLMPKEKLKLEKSKLESARDRKSVV